MSKYQTDMAAPYPLGYVKALERALELRIANPRLYTYPTIADLMGRYHGFHRRAGWWMQELHKAGVPRIRTAEEAERGTRNCLSGKRHLKVAA